MLYFSIPFTHMLDFVAGGNSHAEQPLSSTWFALTDTSRKIDWLLACDGRLSPWSAGVTSSYVHVFIQVYLVSNGRALCGSHPPKGDVPCRKSDDALP